MGLSGPIFALDLAARCGFAVGVAGSKPRAGTMVLKQPGDPRAVAFGNLIAWLNSEWSRERPALVMTEAPLPLQAFRTLGNAAATVRVTHGLHAIVEGMCVRFGIEHEEVADSMIRRHFIGRRNMGERAKTKAAVIQRCHVLGYMPKDCRDDNRADAIALWDYATALHGSRSAALHLFGERAA